ncbi:ribosyldihydronicotinamide dehydrogenase [quinone]-like isoform X1 [Pimephales promelas]|uniref:ribosyldihydronicotinamide dehydrogenase [quinone]-like isoform X1 n=1 Tax=Pimephales promelas TaxID=90988 RepID=UPI0019555F34|nr:ribosyldihydronicotinamide dehydrogenase [quinone]-like isoform X1 [Pimephales promelas]
MAAKTVLIVYAHQSAGSFNAAIKDATVDVLKNQGCNVLVSDLYEMNFKATATKDDITGTVKNPEHFCYGEETMLAWQEGRLASDIVEEHKKLKEADIVIFQVRLLFIRNWILYILFVAFGYFMFFVCLLQFPMYWFSVPAIMKGWMDRVLTLGFAYTSEKRYSAGIFREKKAMLSFTTGSHETMFSSNGINGDLNVTLWPVQNGVLNYCGFQVLAPQVFWAPTHLSSEARDSLLKDWRTRLQGLLSEVPLSFPPIDSFDEVKGFQLKPEVHEKQAGSPFGLTVGHHLEKPLPPHSQMKAGV